MIALDSLESEELQVIRRSGKAMKLELTVPTGRAVRHFDIPKFLLRQTSTYTAAFANPTAILEKPLG